VRIFLPPLYLFVLTSIFFYSISITLQGWSKSMGAPQNAAEISVEELQNLILERQQLKSVGSAFSQPAMNHQPQPVTNHQPQQVHPQPALVTAPQQSYHPQQQMIPTPQQTYHHPQQQQQQQQQQQHQHYNPSNAPQQVLYTAPVPVYYSTPAPQQQAVPTPMYQQPQQQQMMY
jgi:hypothetical protein